MKKSVTSSIILSAIILFSVSIIFMPSNGYAEEISVKSMGVEKTSIITFTNDGTQDVKTFRIWLSQDANFESFKTEKGWIGEKNSQGVIVFSSSESIKENQSVKFGIKTDKPNPVINWKGLDKTNSVIDTGVTSTTKIQKVNEVSEINSNSNIIDKDGEIYSNSVFRIIPDKPNVGSTIRVVGENFGASQLFDFYIDNNKIGSFETDINGDFITTKKIPDNISSDRVDFKIKNNQNEEKIVSLRLGNEQNRIGTLEEVKITINGIKQTTYRGDKLDISGTASTGSTIIVEIKGPSGNIINTRTAEVDSIGNWKLDNPIDIPFNAKFGKYTITVSDGKSQSLKYWTIESNKIISLSPTKVMFEPGKIISFNGTATPNQPIELTLEDNFGNEVASETLNVNESGYIEFTYQTVENDDEEGTWTLIATQNDAKEFSYVGYGEMPIIPINLEFNKVNYSSSENAIISLLGKPSEILKMIIINPTGSINGDEILIPLQEDGRATYELELTGFSSGIYTAIIQKGNSQSSEKFSVGLVTGSGPINVQVTNSEYNAGERILLIGSTSGNSLLTAELIDPNGVSIKKIDVPSKIDGTFKIDQFKVPSDAISGTWKINVVSGTNGSSSEFEVVSFNQDSIVISIGQTISNPGFGDIMNIGITVSQKSSVNLKVFDSNDQQIGDSLSCVPTADFKCEILWTIPKDIMPGTYTIRVSDSHTIAEKDIEIE